MVGISARDGLAALLGELTAPAFSARHGAPPDDLHVEVRGVGPLRLPVTADQARQLRAISRPARYGQGERTLVDPRVRDTWEIPKSRVKIDRRRWNKTLGPVLDRLRADLGIPAGCRLHAELHSMLVYAPGQFFAPHQDSEKADGMLATLVVMLPGASRGGSLVVEHAGARVTYRPSGKLLSLVAFYADCHHEVRPLTSGHRVVLTYNLLLRGDMSDAASGLPAVSEAASDLTPRLDEHFSTGTASRLVYLLDHQYTPRALSWARLKGTDAARAAALRGAAARAHCVAALALAEVHQTWECYDPDWDRPRRWPDGQWDEEWDDEPDDEDALDAEGYELGELLDSKTSLERWIVDEPGASVEPITATVSDAEVCASTPSVNLTPHNSDYEGYMGNYGNTMDRWYRRAAVVLWPRRHDFVVRAEVSPTWALNALSGPLRAGDIAQARQMAASLTPFWDRVARPTPPTLERPDHDDQQGRELLAQALDVAASLDDPVLATTLLAPFRMQLLTPRHAPALARLGRCYGQKWTRELLTAWSGRHTPWSASPHDRLTWLSRLTNMCAAIQDTGAAGAMVAGLLLEDSWDWLAEAIQTRRTITPPTRREQALAELVLAIAALLQAAAETGGTALRDTALAVLCADGDVLLGCLIQLQRATADTPPAARDAAGMDTLARHCTQRLQARLDMPPRNGTDWSIPAPSGCSCPLCDTLTTFLIDPTQRNLDWPLAQKGRQHIHERIDAHEFPVHHQTRRTGRPYTLVLTKTDELFDREARLRRQDQDDITWLREHER